MAKRLVVFCVLFLAMVAGIYWYASSRDTAPAMGLDFLMGEQSSVSVKKQLSVLEELGFSFTAEERAMMEEQDMGGGYADTLFLVGAGSYDFDTGEWTATSDRVYALDTEVFDVGNMYALFLQGLQSISTEELTFGPVSQDDSKVEWEEGTGTLNISFQLNGKDCAMDLEVNTDWLDCTALNKVNGLLKAQGIEKRFYAAWNNYQGMTIFYNTPDWAKQFRSKTGTQLFTEV